MCYCHLPHSSSHICVTQRWCVLMQKPYRVGGTGIGRSRSGLYVEKYYVCICLTHFIVHYLSLHSKCCSIPVTVVCRFRGWNVECCDVDERRGRGVRNWGQGQSRGRADGEEGECLEGISRCSCSWHDFGCSAKGLHSLAFFVMQVVLLLSALYASIINATIILCVRPFITQMIYVKMADIMELFCCMVWQPHILFFLYHQTLQQNADRITLSLYVKYSYGI